MDASDRNLPIVVLRSKPSA